MTLFEELSVHFGEDMALQICAKFQGKHFYFPKLNGDYHCMRSGAKVMMGIKDLFDRGFSVNEIARMKNLRCSTIISALEASCTKHVSSTREKHEGQS